MPPSRFGFFSAPAIADDSDVEEVDEELAAALAMLEEDNTYALKAQSKCCSASSGPVAILEDPTLLTALDTTSRARKLEPRIWQSLDDGCNSAAVAEYDLSISQHPAQVEAYFRKAMLLLRTAASASELADVETLLRTASANLKRYRLITPPWSSQVPCKTELEAGRHAEQRLVLLLLQKGTAEGLSEARKLMAEMGHTYMLSVDVLRNNTNVVPADESRRLFQSGFFADMKSKKPIFLRLVDNALPTPLLHTLQTGFAPRSPFWRVHRYGDIGYFSYLYPLNTRPRSAIECAIQQLFAHAREAYPQAREATVAEYWVHSRSLGYGHQLHFDSDDEGNNGIRHPILGSVFFVDGGDQTGCTLMTNQVLKGPLANQGWMVKPAVNRYMLFDGNMLHGVMCGNSRDAVRHSRRLTFMCAFWREIECRPRPTCEFPHGSAMALDPQLDADWLRAFPLEPEARMEVEDVELSELPEGVEDENDVDADTLLKNVQRCWGVPESKDAFPAFIPTVWERCDGEPPESEEEIPPYEKCYQGM